MPVEPGTCFVVMGYGERTDPDTSKLYDLDKTYRSVIVEGVEKAGFRPVRSDEVTTPGMISRQMYEYLMDAELVVCDITTLNPNALYELGVRMALRPRATVVIAAEGTKIPFNLNQNRFFKFQHGGKVIDYEDAKAAQEQLANACRAAAQTNEPDSLIYSIFEQSLEPPRWKRAERDQGAPVKSLAAADPAADESLLELKKAIIEGKADKRWSDVIARLEQMHLEDSAPIDPWFTQQWALATYKQRENDDDEEQKIDDLLAAREILARLDPDRSTDAETLGLWAAIHKRLSERLRRGQELRRRDLGVAIASYRKGYVLRDDHYNGVNYAFLLVRRALELPSDDERRNVRDLVEAQDVWTHVIELCQDLFDRGPVALTGLAQEEREKVEDDFWATTSLAQSLLAMGDDRYDQARRVLRRLWAGLKEEWMLETTDKQEAALRQMMDSADFKRLSTPPPAREPLAQPGTVT